MTAPTFLIIGDLKAGTTSLHSYVAQHPEVFTPGLKELRFFSFDEGNPYHRRASAYRVKTTAEYLGHFHSAGNAKAIGEASPSYLRSPGAASRIAQLLPNAKLIVSIRNPADRLYSLYQMQLRAAATKLPFDEQLFAADAAWIKGNYYWSELNRFFECFARNQILVVIFDDLAQQPAVMAKQLYRFIGVDDSFEPNLQPQNTGGIPRNPQLYAAMTYSKDRLKQIGSIPPAVRRLWARIRTQSLRTEKLDPLLKRKVLEVCADDIARTASLIQRDLSIWAPDEASKVTRGVPRAS